MKRGYIDAVVVACILAASVHAVVRLEAQGKPGETAKQGADTWSPPQRGMNWVWSTEKPGCSLSETMAFCGPEQASGQIVMDKIEITGQGVFGIKADGQINVIDTGSGGTASADDAQFVKGGISEFCNGDLLVMAEMLAYAVKEHEPVAFTSTEDHDIRLWMSPQLPKSPADQIKDLQAEIKRLTEQAEEDKRRAEAEARRRAHEDDVRGRFQKLLVRLQAGSACP